MSTQLDIFAPKHWSHSTVQLGLTCPCALRLKQSGEPQLVPDNVQAGTDLHDALRRYAEACWSSGSTRDPQAAQRIADGYDDAIRDELLAFAKDARWPWPRVKGGREEPCPVERRLEATLPSGHRWVGVVDLAYTESGGCADNPFAEGNDLRRIIDYKRSRPPAWGQADIPLQLLIYAWMEQQEDSARQEFELFYAAPGWSGKWAFSRWRVSGDLRWVGQRLQATVERLEASHDDRPRPGLHCERCMYIMACPLRKTATLAVCAEMSKRELGERAAFLGAERSKLMGMLKDDHKLTGEIVDIDAETYVGPGPASGWETTDFEAAWDLVQEAQEDLKGRVHGGVKRAWGGVSTEVVKALLKNPKWKARAEMLFRMKTGAGDYGIHKRKAQTDADGDAESDDGDDDQ